MHARLGQNGKLLRTPRTKTFSCKDTATCERICRTWKSGYPPHKAHPTDPCVSLTLQQGQVLVPGCVSEALLPCLLGGSSGGSGAESLLARQLCLCWPARVATRACHQCTLPRAFQAPTEGAFGLRHTAKVYLDLSLPSQAHFSWSRCLAWLASALFGTTCRAAALSAQFNAVLSGFPMLSQLGPEHGPCRSPAGCSWACLLQARLPEQEPHFSRSRLYLVQQLCHYSLLYNLLQCWSVCSGFLIGTSLHLVKHGTWPLLPERARSLLRFS